MRSTRQARDRGATAVEYALLVSLVAAVVSGAVGTLGGAVSASFEQTCVALAPSGGAGACGAGAGAPPDDGGGGKGKKGKDKGNHGDGNNGSNGNHGDGNNGVGNISVGTGGSSGAAPGG